jgi:hypothetical protein
MDDATLSRQVADDALRVARYAYTVTQAQADDADDDALILKQSAAQVAAWAASQANPRAPVHAHTTYGQVAPTDALSLLYAISGMDATAWLAPATHAAWAAQQRYLYDALLRLSDACVAWGDATA